MQAKRDAGKATESLPLRLLAKGGPPDHVCCRGDPELPGRLVRDRLDMIHHLNLGTVYTVVLVVGFCLMQQILLEVALLGYVFAPEGPQDRVARFKAWMGAKGRTAAVIGAGGSPPYSSHGA